MRGRERSIREALEVERSAHVEEARLYEGMSTNLASLGHENGRLVNELNGAQSWAQKRAEENVVLKRKLADLESYFGDHLAGGTRTVERMEI